MSQTLILYNYSGRAFAQITLDPPTSPAEVEERLEYNFARLSPSVKFTTAAWQLYDDDDFIAQAKIEGTLQ